MKTVSISMTKAIIEQALNITVPFTDPKDENAQCVFISIKDGKMEIEATNFGESIRSKSIPCVSKEDVERSAVDGKRLLQVVKAMNAEEIIMQFADDELVIKQGRTRFKINIMSTNSIKEIAFPKGEAMALNSELLRGMERVLHTIDANNPNHNLSGLLMEIGKSSVTMVGSDSKRLAAVKYEHEHSGEGRNILIPKRSCISMIKLFGGQNITAHADDVFFTIETEAVAYSTRLIAGKFPDWAKILKAHKPNIKHNIEIDAGMLSVLAQQAGIINEEAEVIIQNGELTINSENAKSQQSMNAGFAVDYESDDVLSFGVNIRFLLDFVAATDSDILTLSYCDTTLPFFLQASSTLEILMPIVMSQTIQAGAAA